MTIITTGPRIAGRGQSGRRTALRGTAIAATLLAGAMACAVMAARDAAPMPRPSGEAQVATPVLALSPTPAGSIEPVIAVERVRSILRDARRITAPRGVEELRAVEIGGIPQWISVRGKDRRNPILLVVHGGPAYPEMPSSWLYQLPFEDLFTVVQWDQRGAGKTAANPDMPRIASTITVGRMVSDGEEMVALLRKQYGKRKIFVLGHSWGSIMGLELARRHPDWLHAYIGVGQVINWRENERIGYDFALREARARKDAKAIAELEEIAPYPDADGKTPPEKLEVQRKWVIAYGGLTWRRENLDYERNAARLSPEYDLEDDAARRWGGRSTHLLWQNDALDYRGVTRIKCPVLLFAGEYDFETPSVLAANWLGRLRAPYKRLYWLRDVAHEVPFEAPGKLFYHLARDARPIAERAGDAAPIDDMKP